MDYISEFDKAAKRRREASVSVPQVQAGGSDAFPSEPVVPPREGVFYQGYRLRQSMPRTSEEMGAAGVRMVEGNRAVASYAREVQPEVPAGAIDAMGRASALAAPSQRDWNDYQRRVTENQIMSGLRVPEDDDQRRTVLDGKASNAAIAPLYREAAKRELGSMDDAERRYQAIQESERRRQGEIDLAQAKTGAADRYISTDKPVFDPATGKWYKAPQPEIQGVGNRVFRQGPDGNMVEVLDNKPMVVNTPEGGVTELYTVDANGQTVPIRRTRNPSATRISTFGDFGFKSGETSTQAQPVIEDLQNSGAAGGGGVVTVPQATPPATVAPAAPSAPAVVEPVKRRRWKPGDQI